MSLNKSDSERVKILYQINNRDNEAPNVPVLSATVH